MSDGSSFSVPTPPTPQELIKRWELRIRAIDAQVDMLSKDRAEIVSKIGVAKQFLEISSEMDDNEPTLFVIPKTSKHELVAAPSEVQESEASDDSTHIVPDPNGTWVDAIKTWIANYPLGATHTELRRDMDDSPFGSKFQKSQKGYYNALSRLQQRDEIKKHKGRLYTADALEKYLAAVARGEVQEQPEVVSGGYSPMGEAIMDIVFRERFEGVKAPQIVEELKMDDEFHAALNPHHTGAFNIIARLVRRKQVVKTADGLCFPGPSMTEREIDSKWLRPQIQKEGSFA